jgi:hypothetical protein
MYYLCTIGAIALTLAGTVLPLVDASPVVLSCLSSAAAFLVVTVATVRPAGRARAYIAAWREIDPVLSQYPVSTSSDIVQMEFHDAIERGEKIIAGGDFYSL